MDRMSVNFTKDEIQEKNKLKKAYKKGEAKGLKKGFVKGALAGFAVAAALTLGYTGGKAIFHQYPKNIGYEQACESYHVYSHNQYDWETRREIYWVEFDTLADIYDPETMDLDSYIYGVYCGLCNVDVDTRLKDMNEFVRNLYNRGKCGYENFLTYCQSRGLCKIADGKTMVVDEETYRKALKDYMKDFKVSLEAEKNIEEFKGGIRK